MGQGPAANVAQGIEKIEEIKHSERRYAAQSDQCRPGHQNSCHHQSARTETINQPSRKKAKQRSHNKFAQSVTGSDLRARPAELLHDKIVVIRESPKRQAYDAEENQESCSGCLNRSPVHFRAQCRNRIKRLARLGRECDGWSATSSMFCFLASSAGNMSLPTIGNGMESSFECRALSTRACAHLIRGRVGCAVGCGALIIPKGGWRRWRRSTFSSPALYPNRTSSPELRPVSPSIARTHTGLTRSSEVALIAVCRHHSRWTIRFARRPLDRPASLAAWGC